MMGVGVIWFARSPTYAQSFLARVLLGLGGGVIYIATLRYCANWYRADEFATITGLTLGVRRGRLARDDAPRRPRRRRRLA